MKRLAYYFAMLSSAISFVVMLLWSDIMSGDFYIIIFYPLLYGFFLLLIWPDMLRRQGGAKITVGIFLVIQWLRLVALPALGSASGYFKVAGHNIDGESAQTAAYLVLYETIATFIAAFLLLRWKSKKVPLQQDVNQSMELSGNGSVYMLFIILAAFLFLRNGADQYAFFVLNLSEEHRVGFEADGGNAIPAIIDYGLTMLVVMLLYYCYRKYQKTGRKSYVYASLLIALLRICIIDADSDGRLAILYPTGALLLLLPKLYNKHRKLIINSIAIVGIIVVLYMTVYKTFYAFLYDSYLQAIQNNANEFDMYEYAKQLDIYFYGVRTIAQNIYVSQRLDLSIVNLFLDYTRNTFGIHYLIRDTVGTTVAQYNLYIYHGEQMNGYLYSSLAYGATYFSVILAPLMTIGNMVIVAAIENWLRRIKGMDGYYIVSIVFVRMAYNMFCCFPLAWNYASRTLILGAIVIGGASLIKTKQYSRSAPERIYKA